jgi:hypothetical protein
VSHIHDHAPRALARLLIVLLAMVALTSVIACDGSGSDTEGTPGPEESRTPGDSSERLLLYRTLVGTRQSAERSTPIWRIALYDLAEGREISSFEVGRNDPDVPAQATLGGDSVAVNLERRVAVYSFDGEERREIYRVEGEGQQIIGAAISPDGTKVALTNQVTALCPAATPGSEQPQCLEYKDITQVLVFDVETGAEVLRVRQNVEAFAGFVGQAALITWHTDSNGFVVAGFTYSEAPAGSATILLDGTVTVHSSTGYFTEIAPNGTFAARSQPQYCDLGHAPVRPDFQIVELTSGDEANSAAHEGLNVAPYEWSPGGTELAYFTYVLVPDTSPGATPDSCPAEDVASRVWYVLPADGTAARPVADAGDARREWYGDRLLEYRCDGEPSIDPFCAGLDPTTEPLEVLNGGAVIAKAEEFAVIGYPGWSPPR